LVAVAASLLGWRLGWRLSLYANSVNGPRSEEKRRKKKRGFLYTWKKVTTRINKSLENNNKRQKRTCSYDLQIAERKRAIYSIQKPTTKDKERKKREGCSKGKGRK